MKFRNKATKEIRKAEMRDDGIYLYSETSEEWRKCDWEVLAKYWEEYNELEYWYIDSDGAIIFTDLDGDKLWEDLAEERRQIGNYFSSKGEAEKAVEKLRAWKRLKDKGFRFDGRAKPNYRERFIIRCSLPKETLIIDVAKDLDILFGSIE